jgi:hypothetical protein
MNIGEIRAMCLEEGKAILKKQKGTWLKLPFFVFNGIYV